MKALSTLALIFALGAALPAAAQFSGPSSGRTAGVTTVAAAAQARDDTDVVLTGHIVDHQFGDYYTFRDPTGTITVEISQRDFRGQRVTPETTVRLTGEMEVDRRGRSIDVDVLEVLP